MDQTKVDINTETIRLDQFLKWAGAAGTGGEAKSLVKQGLVKVNGESEARRGRSLSPGDLVAVAGVGEFMVTRQGG